MLGCGRRKSSPTSTPPTVARSTGCAPPPSCARSRSKLETCADAACVFGLADPAVLLAVGLDSVGVTARTVRLEHAQRVAAPVETAFVVLGGPLSVQEAVAGFAPLANRLWV